MKIEIASTQGRKLASAFKQIGLSAQGDDEGVMVTTRTSSDKKKIVDILLKHGMDHIDIKDGYPELLESEEITEESETEFDFTVNEDGTVTMSFGDIEYDISADDVEDLIEACGKKVGKKDVGVKESSGMKSFNDFLAERMAEKETGSRNDDGELDEFM